MPVQVPVRLALDHIQGNIVPGFYKDAQDFVFVRFTSPEAGRAWLLSLTRPGLISSAAEVNAVNSEYTLTKQISERAWANLAISRAGLEFIEADLQGFPREFLYTPELRARRLGDARAAGSFLVGGTDAREAHALLILGANDDAHMQTQLDRFSVSAGNVAGNPIVHHFKGRSRGDGKEHFGFYDSLSQPVPSKTVDANGWDTSTGDMVMPGEFILGQPREPRDTDHGDHVSFDEPAWAADGSYLVFRSMKQYVQAFTQAAKQCASTLKTEHGMDVTSEDVMAQLVGRSRCDQRPDLDLDPDHCPYFAHVRKANPRDLQYAQSNQHRIIRRGIPYTNSADDLGLLFVAYQASIARQFEFIQTQWLGINTFPQPAVNSSSPALSPERMPGADPLTGFATPGNRIVMFHKPGSGHTLADYVRLELPTFTEVTGSGYFFSPSIPGITALLDAPRVGHI